VAARCPQNGHSGGARRPYGPRRRLSPPCVRKLGSRQRRLRHVRTRPVACHPRGTRGKQLMGHAFVLERDRTHLFRLVRSEHLPREYHRSECKDHQRAWTPLHSRFARGRVCIPGKPRLAHRPILPGLYRLSRQGPTELLSKRSPSITLCCTLPISQGAGTFI
jgi:hypothetical protein